MSGSRYLLDTNAIIAILNGNLVLPQLENADWIGISIISKLEFIAYPNLKTSDKRLFFEFCHQVEIVDLMNDNDDLIQLTSTLRNRYKLKLPDAIIGASALQNNAKLVTKDQVFKKIAELRLI